MPPLRNASAPPVVTVVVPVTCRSPPTFSIAAPLAPPRPTIRLPLTRSRLPRPPASVPPYRYTARDEPLPLLMTVRLPLLTTVEPGTAPMPPMLAPPTASEYDELPPETLTLAPVKVSTEPEPAA